MRTRVLHTKHVTFVLGGAWTIFGLGFDANWSGRGHGGLASINFMFWYLGVEW